MRLVRRATLPIAFLLLTSAATVHAECAWGLWYETQFAAKTTGKSSQWWNILDSSATEAACKRVLEDTVKQVSRPRENVTTQVKGSLVIKEDAGTLTTLRYVCLPDTVDPRGPKEK